MIAGKINLGKSLFSFCTFNFIIFDPEVKRLDNNWFYIKSSTISLQLLQLFLR